ncbi:hypothetical protein U9M48_001021, partial [Paspalum notatum var. saurae]
AALTWPSSDPGHRPVAPTGCGSLPPHPERHLDPAVLGSPPPHPERHPRPGRPRSATRSAASASPHQICVWPLPRPRSDRPQPDILRLGPKN